MEQDQGQRDTVGNGFDSKRFLVLIVVLILVGVSFYYLIFLNRDSIKANSFVGSIAWVEGNEITARGVIILEDGARNSNVSNLEKTIVFTVNPNTTLIKKTVIFRIQNINSQEPFDPENVETSGELSELKPGMPITVKSSRNLVKRDVAPASEINYSVTFFER
jgi:hypothetical protein